MTTRSFVLAILLLTANVLDAQDAQFGGVFGGFGTAEWQGQASDNELGTNLTRDVKRLRQAREDADEPANGQIRESHNNDPVSFSIVSNTLITKLHNKVDMEFVDTPLEQFAAWFANQLGVNVVFDHAAMHDEGIDVEKDHISFVAPSMSYRAGLIHGLEQFGLTYVMDANVLTITSEDNSESSLTTRVYPVWDLVEPLDSSDPESADYDTLIDNIEAIVFPETWDSLGGQASLHPFKGMLTISQTHQAHEQVEALLRGIRRFRPLRSLEAKDKRHVTAIGLDDGQEKPDIMQALRKKIDIRLEDVSLESLTEVLRTKVELTYLLDLHALEEEAVAAEEPLISCSLRQVSLNSALKLILNDLNLTHIVNNEAVVITSRDKAEETLSTRIYSCAALVENSTATSLVRDDLDELIHNITSTESADTWDMVGGPGVIKSYPRRGLLIVSNTDDVHADVEAQLKLLLQGQLSGNAAPTLDTEPDDAIVRVYRLSEEYENPAARSALVSAIEHLSSDSDDYFSNVDEDLDINVVGRNLIVSHRREAQAAIGAILRKLEALDLATQRGATSQAKR